MMNRQFSGTRGFPVVGVAASLVFLAGACGAWGAEPAGDGGSDANVRFHGAPTYDFGVTNVKWEAGTKDYSFVTFDLAWSYSWRLKWTEPAKTSATGKDMELENWDAAWVFIKFRKPGAEWAHATLSTEPHTMETLSEGVVAEARMINGRFHELRFKDAVPAGVCPGFAIANVTRMPAAVIRGCRTGNNRPRGFLLTSNRPMLIEGNTFYNSSHAIHVSGDANYWFESGPVRDLTSRGNTFQNCG